MTLDTYPAYGVEQAQSDPYTQAFPVHSNALQFDRLPPTKHMKVRSRLGVLIVVPLRFICHQLGPSETKWFKQDSPIIAPLFRRAEYGYYAQTKT